MRDWITIWQSELSATATDPEVPHVLSRLLGLWVDGAAAVARLIPDPAVAQDGDQGGSPAGAHGGGTGADGQALGPGSDPPAGNAGAAPPAGPPPADAAPDARDAALERLARRVAELERRVARLQRTDGT